MAVNRDKLFDSIANGAAWDAGVVFNRTNGIPIDKYSVFETYEEAADYAKNNPVAYPGQYIAVINENNTVKPHVIAADGTLIEVATTVDTENAKAYADQQIASKTLVQILTWEDDD